MGKKPKGAVKNAKGTIDGNGIDSALAPHDPKRLAETEGAAVLSAQAPEAPEIRVGTVPFDLDEPDLPKAIEDAALSSGGYPYEEPIKDKVFEDQLRLLQTAAPASCWSSRGATRPARAARSPPSAST
jgi:hypothetical protein